MNTDAYKTFIGAKGVAFAWIGAVFGPALLYIGLQSVGSTEFWVGLVLTIIFLMCMVDGIRALKYSAYSDFIAYAVVPVSLFLCLVTWALLGSNGYLPYG